MINDKRISIPFCPKNDALTRKSEKNRNNQALTRERRRAKRNPHLASAQVNGRAALSMLRSLAGEGFRLERMPLRVTVRRGRCCALLRVRGCGCRPNGMELSLSLARGRSRRRLAAPAEAPPAPPPPFCPKGLSLTRRVDGVRVVVDKVYRWCAG